MNILKGSIKLSLLSLTKMNQSRFTVAVYCLCVCVSTHINLNPTHLKNKFYGFYSFLLVIKIKDLIAVYLCYVMNAYVNFLLYFIEESVN